jgi:hypothetical protein
MDGTPAANAEVSLGVVDESIYSIQPDSATDIRREFTGNATTQCKRVSPSLIPSRATPEKDRQARAQTNAFQLADFKTTTPQSNPSCAKFSKTLLSGNRTL